MKLWGSAFDAPCLGKFLNRVGRADAEAMPLTSFSLEVVRPGQAPSSGLNSVCIDLAVISHS